MTKDEIKAIFLANGFPINPWSRDLPKHVYDAAYALLEASKKETQMASDLRDLLRECRPIVMCKSPSSEPFDFPRELIARIDAALASATPAKRYEPEDGGGEV